MRTILIRSAKASFPIRVETNKTKVPLAIVLRSQSAGRSKLVAHMFKQIRIVYIVCVRAHRSTAVWYDRLRFIQTTLYTQIFTLHNYFPRLDDLY